MKAGGARVGTLQFNNTGRWRSWDDTPALAFELLSAGTIELTASTEDGGPNVDYLELTRLEGEPDPEPPSDDPPAPPGGPQPSLRVDLRPAGTDLRLASYNINHDRPFRPNLERLELGSAFERLIASVDADIWCLQEVENSSGLSERQKLDVLTEHRPSGERWYSAWDDRGIFFASRYPIVDSERIDSLVYATWIDLPSSVSSRDLVVIGMHLKGNKTPKARNAVRFIEDVRGGSFAGASIDRDVTVVVCGDFNTNPGGGSHREIDRVLTDISPIQLGTHDERGTIGSVRFDSNGRWISTPSNIIDFLFYGGPYSGSVTRSFVLNPAILGDRYLADNGLEWWDIATNGSQDRDRGRRGTSVHVDHLPQIADFNLR